MHALYERLYACTAQGKEEASADSEEKKEKEDPKAAEKVSFLQILISICKPLEALQFM